jgi:hypothetical protein
VPSCVIDPLRDQFLALLPGRSSPAEMSQPRIPDAAIFDKLVHALVPGMG